MNDFTKEELEFLWEATRHIGKQGVELNSDIHPYLLKDKIQSMIKNYCEHVLVFRVHDSVVYCSKCRREVNGY